MKLKHITFTGIDQSTNIEDLVELQNKYPLVEFGVLLSVNWKENGPRFFDPKRLDILRDRGLNLSAHICGSAAKELVVNGNWEPINNITHGLVGIFNRCQLNVAGQSITKETQFVACPHDLEELIIQQKDVRHLNIYNACKNKSKISVLLDASGGQGIDTPIEICNSVPKVGYAGGIDIDNVREKLQYLVLHPAVTDFWIDMETGVRTNDRFDIQKCYKICEAVKQVLQNAYSVDDFKEFWKHKN